MVRKPKYCWEAESSFIEISQDLPERLAGILRSRKHDAVFLRIHDLSIGKERRDFNGTSTSQVSGTLEYRLGYGKFNFPEEGRVSAPSTDLNRLFNFVIESVLPLSKNHCANLLRVGESYEVYVS